jgi:hypothetical protein
MFGDYAMTTTPITSITDELLAEIEAMARLATPGPWVSRAKHDSPSFQGYYVSNYGVDMYAALGTSNQDEIDASFIAYANPATVLAMTTELRRLRAENEALRGDKELLDWLADPENEVGNVQLPTKCVMDNLGSLRDAIRQAMQSNTEGK